MDRLLCVAQLATRLPQQQTCRGCSIIVAEMLQYHRNLHMPEAHPLFTRHAQCLLVQTARPVLIALPLIEACDHSTASVECQP